MGIYGLGNNFDAYNYRNNCGRGNGFGGNYGGGYSNPFSGFGGYGRYNGNAFFNYFQNCTFNFNDGSVFGPGGYCPPGYYPGGNGNHGKKGGGWLKALGVFGGIAAGGFLLNKLFGGKSDDSSNASQAGKGTDTPGTVAGKGTGTDKVCGNDGVHLVPDCYMDTLKPKARTKIDTVKAASTFDKAKGEIAYTVQQGDWATHILPAVLELLKENGVKGFENGSGTFRANTPMLSALIHLVEKSAGVDRDHGYLNLPNKPIKLSVADLLKIINDNKTP